MNFQSCKKSEVCIYINIFITHASLRQIQRILKSHGLSKKPLQESRLTEIEAAILVLTL